MKKILVVSESLGEPNHKRGIFHFTRELIRSLAAKDTSLRSSSKPRAAIANCAGGSSCRGCCQRIRA